MFFPPPVYYICLMCNEHGILDDDPDFELWEHWEEYYICPECQSEKNGVECE